MYGPARRLRLPFLLLALLAASCAPGRTPISSMAALALPSAIVTAPVTTGADQLLPLPDGPSAFAAISGALRDALARAVKGA